MKYPYAPLFLLAALAVPLPRASAAPQLSPAAGWRTVEVSSPESAALLQDAGASVVADYGTFVLMDVPAGAADLPGMQSLPGVQLRDEYRTIALNAGPLDTTRPEVQSMRSAVSLSAGKQMRLVQFRGPVQPEWHAALLKTGVRIVTYIPSNAYLVYGDAASIGRAAQMAQVSPFVQWDGPYGAAFRIQPSVRDALSASGKGQDARSARPKSATEKNEKDQVAPGFVSVTIQLVEDKEENAVTLALVDRVKTAGKAPQGVLEYVNVSATVPNESIAAIAARPDVVSIERRLTPVMHDERQDFIVAGGLRNGLPGTPDYLGWLAAKGFNQAQFTNSGLVVDVGDSGLDNATTSPNHFALYLNGVRPGTSRVAYARIEGTGDTAQGCDGHGTLNASIVAGYSARTGFPHQDSAGFRYGLGVAPFVKVGSSVLFAPDFTEPDYEDMISRAYRDGARISTNSWGANYPGLYTTDSQAYDALTRDAQPTGSAVPVTGNQGILFIFSSGNAGPGPYTVGSPGTGKNVITVGATENIQAFDGMDRCGEPDSRADSAHDMALFSSRGPCADGRFKPDIVAPGTHVSGIVYQAATQGANGTAATCFDGSGVCGGVDSMYFPAGQQFYSASTGTSHSAPAVAGGAALVWQAFRNEGITPSPAMVKARLLNSATHLTGSNAGDSLPSAIQGMGGMDLERAFDATTSQSRILRDQVSGDTFTATGQTRTFTGSVADPTQPFRVTLVWTDAPGSTTGAAWRNDLDLTVTVGGREYKGNVFSGAYSVAGGAADTRNNAESVFLPAGVNSPFRVTVTARNINSDGVPNSGGALDQDFALLISNAAAGNLPVVTAAATGVTSESCAPANGVPDPGETVTIALSLTNTGSLAIGNLNVRLMASPGVVPSGGAVSHGNLAVNASKTVPVTFSLAAGAGPTVNLVLLTQDSTTDIGTLTVPVTLGVLMDTVEQSILYSGPALAIPDNGAIDSPLSVDLDGIVEDINVRVRLDHTYNGDLALSLIGPDGTRILLTGGLRGSNLGSGSDCSSATVFDDEAPVAIHMGSGSYRASYQPQQGLAAFKGKELRGNWTLRIDDAAPEDVGSLLCWGLDVQRRLTKYCGVPGVPIVVKRTSTLSEESCTPANNVPDPGETVTLNITLRNHGSGDAGNVVATFIATPGVVPVVSTQVYGAMVAGGNAVTRSFRYTVNADCGEWITPTLQLRDGATDLGTITFPVRVGQIGLFQPETFTSGGLSRSIEDGGGIEAPITISRPGVAGALRVRVRIDHTYVSDLRLTLVGPDGTSAVLAEFVGGDGENFGSGAASCSGTFTVFDDAAATPIGAGSAPFAGSYRPSEALSVFAGKPVDGTWKLIVEDYAWGDSGVLYCWGLDVMREKVTCCGIPGVPIVIGTTSAIVSESCQPANGWMDQGETVGMSLTLRNIGAGATSNLKATLLPMGGVEPINGNQTYGVMAGDGPTATQQFSFLVTRPCGETITPTFSLSDGALDLGTVSFQYRVGGVSAVPHPILSSGNLAAAIPDNGTLERTLASTVTGSVHSVRVQVRLNHTWDDDLRLTLVGPDGTTVALAEFVGGDGENFGSGAASCSGIFTIFDDNAATPIGAGSAPFIGSFRPSEPLSAFAGKPANGTWKLRVEDTAGGDVGTLYCWGLWISTGEPVCCGGPFPAFEPGGLALTAETCVNNAVDPGEQVTVALTVRNDGAAAIQNVTAALEANNGVAPVSGTQDLGTVAAGASVTRSFTFRASAACGDSVTLRLLTRAGLVETGAPEWVVPMGQASQGTVNALSTGAITILDHSAASPYPSVINVANAVGRIERVAVSLSGLTHTYVGDLDIMLVSPGGQAVMLISDITSSGVSGVNLVLDDSAENPLPGSGSLTSGTYRPTNYGEGGDVLPAPAPTATTSLLSAFQGSDPNGAWRLYINDQASGDSGRLNSWSLQITTRESTCCAPPFTMNDALQALRASCGLLLGTPGDLARLDVRKAGASNGRLTVEDAVGIARKVTGLEPNP